MKKTKIIAVFMALVLCLLGCGKDGISTDGFRGSSWGDTVEQVKETETAELVHEQEQSLRYSDEFLGYACDFDYKFNDGKLFGCVCTLDVGDSDVDAAISTVNASIEKTYGKPTNESKAITIYKKNNNMVGIYAGTKSVRIEIGENLMNKND